MTDLRKTWWPGVFLYGAVSVTCGAIFGAMAGWWNLLPLVTVLPFVVTGAACIGTGVVAFMFWRGMR